MRPGRIDYTNPVNRRHSHNKRLLSWWLPLENAKGGDSLRDFARRRSNATLDGGPTWVSGPNGFRAVGVTGGSQIILPTDNLGFVGGVQFFDSFQISFSIRVESFPGAFTALIDDTVRMLSSFYGVTGDPSFGVSFGSLSVGVWYRLSLGIYAVGLDHTKRSYRDGRLVASVAGDQEEMPTTASLGGIPSAGGGTAPTARYSDARLDNWPNGGSAADHDRLADADYQQWRRGFPDLLSRRRTAVSVPAGGGGTTVTPTAASLTLATFAPTVAVTANQVATPDTLALSLTTFAPTVAVTANVRVVPTTLALALTAFAPAVAGGGDVTVTPSTASLALQGFAPVVNTPRRVTPPAPALSLTGFAPAVAATAHVRVTPGTLALALTGFAPTVTGDVFEPPARVAVVGSDKSNPSTTGSDYSNPSVAGSVQV